MAVEYVYTNRDKLLEKLFREYYSRNDVSLPRDIRLREFAAQLWGQSTYIRHLAFRTYNEVKSYLAKKAPRHFYYSSARYAYPDIKDMDAKKWLSADLTFDIDADHLEECKNKIIEVDDRRENIKATFIEPECITLAAWEAVKLVDTLIFELGVSKDAIRVEFSGHRGFHVIVEDEREWGRSTSEIRREIVNYLLARDLKIDVLEPRIKAERSRMKIVKIPPLPSSPGIRGRVARIALWIIKRKYGIEVFNKISKKLVSPQGFLQLEQKLKESYINAVEEAKEAISVRIDEQVTVDVKRLIRPPGSLHGKTGLMVKTLTLNEIEELFNEISIESFSPFTSYDPFRVKSLLNTPTLNIMGNRLKLRRNIIYKFPAPIAIYLLAKGVAIPA